MRENAYQANLVRRIKRRFPGCVVLKNDTSYIQGIPDLLVLYNDKWAMLEVKRSGHEEIQPNQDYYINMLSEMSFAEFIFPENEEDVLDALQQAFEPRRRSRLSKS